LTAAGVLAAGQPSFERAGDTLARAVAAAEIEPAALAGVLCSGPAATPPAVGAIAAASGLDAVAVGQPRWAALLGAAHAVGSPTGTPDVGEPPEPTYRRVMAGLVAGVGLDRLYTHFLLSAHREQPAGVSVANSGCCWPTGGNSGWRACSR